MSDGGEPRAPLQWVEKEFVTLLRLIPEIIEAYSMEGEGGDSTRRFMITIEAAHPAPAFFFAAPRARLASLPVCNDFLRPKLDSSRVFCALPRCRRSPAPPELPGLRRMRSFRRPTAPPFAIRSCAQCWLNAQANAARLMAGGRGNGG